MVSKRGRAIVPKSKGATGEDNQTSFIFYTNKASVARIARFYGADALRIVECYPEWLINLLAEHIAPIQAEERRDAVLSQGMLNTEPHIFKQFIYDLEAVIEDMLIRIELPRRDIVQERDPAAAAEYFRQMGIAVIDHHTEPS